MFDIFPDTWQMMQLQTYEFCRLTKLHIDGILSTQYTQIDVSLIIDTMQQTIEFENELAKQFDVANQKIRQKVQVVNGKAFVLASGTADEIREKYIKQFEMDEDILNQEAFKKLQTQKSLKGLTKLQPRIYEFRGCISQCFEPYLKSYSEQEQVKITQNLDQKMGEGQDLLETIDYVVYGSSLHLFKNVKASMKRCLTFSKSKALFDLQVVFKNAFKYYTRLLRKKLPEKAFEAPV